MRFEWESSRWRVYRLKVLTSNERVDWWYWLCGTQHFASHRILWVLIIRFVLNSCTIYHDALISCGSSNHSQTQFEVPNMRTDFPNRLWWPFRPTDYWFCDELQSYLLASISPERVTYYILNELNSQIIILESFYIKLILHSKLSGLFVLHFFVTADIICTFIILQSLYLMINFDIYESLSKIVRGNQDLKS